MCKGPGIRLYRIPGPYVEALGQNPWSWQVGGGVQGIRSRIFPCVNASGAAWSCFLGPGNAARCSLDGLDDCFHRREFFRLDADLDLSGTGRADNGKRLTEEGCADR